MSDSATVRILGIAGSLRRGSFNAATLRAAQELAPAGMTIDSFDIAPVPLYNEDVRSRVSRHRWRTCGRVSRRQIGHVPLPRLPAPHHSAVAVWPAAGASTRRRSRHPGKVRVRSLSASERLTSAARTVCTSQRVR
jgi:hypothetical protein